MINKSKCNIKTINSVYRFILLVNLFVSLLEIISIQIVPNLLSNIFNEVYYGYS